MDMNCDVWDTPYVNFENGVSRRPFVPGVQACANAVGAGVAICFGRSQTIDHKPVPIDPRNALVRQVERARAMGFEVRIGTELEFFLLDPETDNQG